MKWVAVTFIVALFGVELGFLGGFLVALFGAATIIVGFCLGYAAAVEELRLPAPDRPLEDRYAIALEELDS